MPKITVMATWVEGKPAPTPKNTLSDVNDIVNETKSPWTRISPLSDASNKARESATPVSPHIFDNDGKLNYNLGSVTKPVTGPKPTLTPRLFCLEKSSVPYPSLGTTQAPLSAPKPISGASIITPLGKLAVDIGDAKASFRNTEAKHAPSGTVLSVLSSFAQKPSLGSDNISWMRAGDSQDGETLLNLHSTPKLSNFAVSSSPMTLSLEETTEEKSEHSATKPTTIVILETSVQKLKSKKSSEDVKDIGKCRDSSEDQKLQGTMQPFMSSKPSIHSRKYSPSATQGFGTSKPAALLRASSLRILGKWDRFAEEDKDKMDKEKDSTESPPSPRVQLRKPRPLSAWHPGATNDQKSESPSEITIMHNEKPSTLEKPWLKNPRPLSVDLTDRFEASAHKRNVPLSEDSKENVPINKADSAVPSGTRCDLVVQQEESVAVAEKCWSSASPNDHEVETNSCFLVAKKKFINSPKMDIRNKDVKAYTLYERDNKEQITSPERKILWENDLNDTKITPGQGKEEKKEKIPATSLRTDEEKLGTDQEQLKSRTNKKLDKECSDLGRASDGECSSLGFDDRGSKGNKVPVSGGIIKSRISLLLDSASNSTAKIDCPQSAPEKETINIPVRQRIQTLTSENNDSKREQLRSSQRRSYQPRPLSSDITKRFETQAIGVEGHGEKHMNMAISSSPEHSVLQNTQEQGRRESREKDEEDETDMTKNDQLHLMDIATKFRWSRRQSVKKVSKAFDKLTTDEKTGSEKISRKSSFNRREEEMKRQINETDVPMSFASVTRVGTESSDGQQTVTASMDAERGIKAVRVFVTENEVQCHKVPEFVHLEDPSYLANSCFDKGKRSEQTAHSELKNYITMKRAAEVMPGEKETNKTKSLEPEVAVFEGKKKIYFESEEGRVSRPSINTPPSSQVTAQNVSGLLLPASSGKIDNLQDVSEKAVSSSLPTTSEDKVMAHCIRKLPSMIDQTKRDENVSGPRRHWNQSLPAEKSSTLQPPSTAPNFGLRKDNEATNQELQPSARSIDGKDSKGSDGVEVHKEAKRLLQGDGTIELSGMVPPKERRDKRRKKVSLEPNSTVFTTGHTSDYSTGTSYVQHRSVSVPLSTTFSRSVGGWKDSLPEEHSKSYTKLPTAKKPKTTLLSEAFLDMPWTNRESDDSDENRVTPTVKQSKMADTDKSRKRGDASDRYRHNILDLDTLMVDYRKETSIRKNEESKLSHCHDEKDNQRSNTRQKDYEEQSTEKVIKSAVRGLGKSPSSGKSKGTSEMLNKKHLHRNSVLDLDALMAEYEKGIPEPVDPVRKKLNSKPADAVSPTVKIPKSSSFASYEVKTYQKNDQIKGWHNEEFKRDACDNASADLKKRSKDEKRKSRPSSVYNECDELGRCDLRSNDQRSEGKQFSEVDTLTSTPAILNRRPKHEKKKSRPSSIYTEQGELEQPELRTDGQKSDYSREKGKPREDDCSELRPRHRKNRSEERKSKITTVQTDSSTQVLDGHCPDGKIGILDYLTSSRRPVQGSPHLVLEKEKYVEMSVDNGQHAKVENKAAGRKEESEWKFPRIMIDYPKDLNQSVPEVKKSRPLEIHRQARDTVDGLFLNQEGTPNSRSHEERKSCSIGEDQHGVAETMVHTRMSMAEDKMGSHYIEREQPTDLPSKVQRKVGDMILLTSKTKKQNEKKVYSRRSVQQVKSQEHKVDRVKQWCISPSTKVKDTDTLVQEKDQFCNCEERDQYGTYDERGSSTNEEGEPYSKYLERKQCEEENYRPVLPYNEPASIPAASPTRERVQSQISMSSQSEVTSASERLSFFQDPRNISSGLSSGELESPDDTDSCQSTDQLTDVGPSPQGFPFLEPVTTLDSGALKSRIQLGRKTVRRAPTKHRKTGFGDQPNGTDQFLQRCEESWMYKDSTESRPAVQEELVEEEVRRPEKLTRRQCPRVAMFPGMDPSVLKASLRRKRPEDEAADLSNCEQHYGSCSPPAQQGFRVLPATTSKREGSGELPPPWLQELKSKKRLSQHQPCSPDSKNE
ncbi:uncharacterized protein KIAA1671-like [Heterodontus francisci]|uniref:uncharacterized protein KIAA1671-like n=1 Tax=Heterodontus francisci TaxID=7792 RepID=UPI00355C3C56